MATLNTHYVTTPGPDTQATVDLYIDNPDALGGGSAPGDNSITTSMLQANSVTNEKIANGTIQASKLASGVIPTIPGNATTETPGLVKQAAAVGDVSAAPTQQEFNGLLAALRAAGVLATA